MTPLQAELGLLKGKLAAAQNEADTLSRMPECSLENVERCNRALREANHWYKLFEDARSRTKEIADRINVVEQWIAAGNDSF